MGIKVSTDVKNYVISITSQLKQILAEISNHNIDTSSHQFLLSVLARKADQSTTYTKSEITDLLKALPTLDLSGQIGTHNTNSFSHEDIRALISSEVTRAQAEEVLKVDKIDGKGLSTNDFTNTLLALLNKQSGTNTGDETKSTIISKIGGTGICSIGTCSTASATAEKVVSLSGFSLNTGATILVVFTAANTASVPTLNVNSTGAKPIYNEAGTAVSAANPAYFPAGSTIEFTYDGTNWVFKKKVVENYVNGTSWYRIYSDGFIEQGGRGSGGGTSSGITVNLLKAFSNTNYNVLTVVTAGVTPPSTTFSATPYIGAFTTTSFGVICANSSSGFSSQAFIWETRGY